MTMSNYKNAKLPFLEKLFCILLIWGSGTQLTIRFSYVYYAIVITFVLIVLSGKFHYNKQMLLPAVVVLCLTTLSVIQNYLYMRGTGIQSTINNYVMILCPILFAINNSFLSTKRIEFTMNVFLFFSVLSTILFIIFSLGALPVTPIITETMELPVLTFFYLLNVVPSDLIDSIYRNGGIYWEPGMYQVFLNFALVYYLFNKHLKYRKLIVFYLTINVILTISVSGYALTCLIFSIYAIRNPATKGLYKLLARIIIIVVLVGILPTVLDLITAKQDTSSYSKRYFDLVLAWDVFQEHPMMGYGMVNDAYAKAYFRYVGEVRPSSNGLMNILMGTGILGAIIYFVCYFRSLKFFSFEYSKYISLPLLLWLLMSFSTEPMQYQPFICLLFGVGLAYTVHQNAHVSLSQQRG